METTLFLSKLFGLTMFVMGVGLLVNWRDFRDMVVELVKNKGLFYLIAMIELIAGLAIVLSHNSWNNLLEIFVSVIGWMMTAEAVFYMLAPHEKIKGFIEYLNKKSFYMIGSVVYLVLGAYLIYGGFFL